MPQGATCQQHHANLLCSQAWQAVCARVLDPEQPFELHQQLFAAIYSAWDEQQHGPPPVWVPDARQVAATNIARFMSRFHVSAVPGARWLGGQQSSHTACVLTARRVGKFTCTGRHALGRPTHG